MVGSPAHGKKGGVVTLIKKILPYTISTTDTDKEGRRITITLKPTDPQLTQTLPITNIYAPNTDHKTYYQRPTDWFLTSPTEQHILGETLTIQYETGRIGNPF